MNKELKAAKKQQQQQQQLTQTSMPLWVKFVFLHKLQDSILETRYPGRVK